MVRGAGARLDVRRGRSRLGRASAFRYARDSTWTNADFTNGVVDRVSFDGSKMRGAIFANTVLTGTSFEGADLENADFSEAFIGDFELRALCKNPTLKGENPKTGAPTRASAGCR